MVFNKKRVSFQVLNFFIAMVWLVNGLCCKLLNFVPRHQQIVERILEKNDAREITLLIGSSEIVMSIWIISSYQPRLNAITQIMVIFIMNLLEFILASDLLLWGKFNTIFALLFIIIIYINSFLLFDKPIK